MGYHLRVKICGVTNVADALAAAELGADAIGLNFYQRSARCITVDVAREILRQLPAFVQPVGLFVEEPWSEITRRLAALPGLRTVQWHGAKPEASAPPELDRIVAFPIKDWVSLSLIPSFLDRCRAEGQLPRAVLVDASVSGMHGGTGTLAPWDLLTGFQAGVPLILAGGLNPDNVAEAVHRLRPYAVDVATGVESSPGRKDREHVRKFIAAAREAARECP